MKPLDGSGTLFLQRTCFCDASQRANACLCCQQHGNRSEAWSDSWGQLRDSDPVVSHLGAK